MTPQDRDDGHDDVPQALLEEAAVWHARMRDTALRPGTASDARADFERWLAADPRHRPAYAETRRLWDRLAVPVEALLRDQARAVPKRPPRWRRPAMSRLAGLAAGLVLLAIAGLAFQDDIVSGLLSDYATAAGQQSPLDLADGSHLRLNTDTAVAVDLNPDRRRVRMFKGQAWFDVAMDAGRPFVVETAMGTVGVVGTRFDIRVDDDVAVVSLFEGQIALTPASAPATPVTLSPGEQARLTTRGVARPVRFDRTQVTAWQRGQLVFYDTPLADVAAELNRYRNGHIVVVDGDLDGLKISGVFRTDDPDAALTVIADTLPVRVTRLTDYLVLLH